LNKYFLHVGLHKTGTKFFQHKVFPNLPKDEFIYNPPKLTQLICDLVKTKEEDLHLVLDAIESEKNKLEGNESKKIVISREIMSGDLFSFYTDHRLTNERLHRGFPKAFIICFLRFQVDWIVSCYRETVHEHHYQPINEFLSLKKGGNSFKKVNYKNFDLPAIVSSLKSYFPEDQIVFFFFENFKTDKMKIVFELSKILGITNMTVNVDYNKIPNRGYSAFSIKLSLIRYKILKYFGLKKIFIHRPINFFGDNSIPAGFEHLSVLPKEKYWHNGFLRDNEELRSINYPNSLTIIEKIRLKTSWRSIIKNGVDKIIYFDWDLLGQHREKMERYFYKENVKLRNIIPKELIPKRYFEKR
jgi:hypothetical protein